MKDFSDNFQSFKKLKKPKGVIFDWDNTLVNTWPLIQESINTTMRFMGRDEWDIEKVRSNVHRSMRESFPVLFGDEWEKAGKIYRERYQNLSPSIELLNGSLELIATLNQLGIIQFIVSNKIGATLRKELSCLGLERKFFSAIGAQDTNFDKPAVEPVNLALSLSDLDVKKDEIWFVGDTIADIQCALNFGCTPVLFAESSELISNSIDQKILETGNYGTALPLYFDHLQLVELLKNFS